MYYRLSGGQFVNLTRVAAVVDPCPTNDPMSKLIGSYFLGQSGEVICQCLETPFEVTQRIEAARKRKDFWA